MGPLITAKHREGVERYVELGVSEGGRIRAGGVRPHGDGRDRGYFYTPTILDGLDQRRAHLPGRDLRPGAGRDAVRRRSTS